MSSQPYDLFHQPPTLNDVVEDAIKEVSSLEPMEVAVLKRDAAMSRVQAKAGEDFGRKAREFILSYLRQNGATSGEDVTDACKAAGITPHDDRAFGPVYMSLSRNGHIRKAGMVPRRKGHATAGGYVWELNNEQL